MIGKEQFIKAVNLYLKHDVAMSAFEELFPGGFAESPFADYFWSLQDILFKVSFDERGLDWINAYLYEDCREYWDSDEHHEINNLDDLWELIKEYRI